MKFTKMHGCGNDYVYVNCFEENIENPKQLAIEVSNRNFGIGSDGLILIQPSEVADFRMSMYNADGSQSEMCGNGIRCVGKYVYDHRMTEQKEVSVETLAGIKILKFEAENNRVKLVTVDMGEPIFDPKQIPVISDENPVINKVFEKDGFTYPLTCISMGNPHGVTFVDDVKSLDLELIGPKFENHKDFPERANIEFIEVISRDYLKMRVWERGSGETLACGTGACASLVASVLNGKSDRKATLELLGGNLIIEWDEKTNHVFMTGPATTVYAGEFYENGGL